MNKIEYPSQNNLYLNLEMGNGSNKVKINDERDYHENLNYGYKFTDDSQTTYNKRLATATEYNKSPKGGSRRRRPSRKYKKSKRVFRKKSRSTRRR